ncbi:hypothetical protein [Streptomyces sp. CMB-StM0423]|uniref:hypothetical protein n=1 Tax=Streptomyces sp. CMB-StM0423 TaxID=2059884 RepID=UPI001F292E9E|nr:hypothetical protein [Streptomyces sp. CMB-StM0423]
MTTSRTSAQGQEQGRQRRWLGLAVLALPALLASLELTVTNLALPAIGRDLGAGSTQLLWTVDIYAFLLAGSLITMQGAAAAISSTAPQLGGALGIALLGSVITAVYRGRTDGAVPEGVPADAAGAFEDDLSATVTAAERLPGPVGDELLGAARGAFETGFQVAAGVCAALTAATAVLVALAGVRGKRRVSP